MDEISVPGVLFQEFILDISDDIAESAASEETLLSNGQASHVFGEEMNNETLPASDLEVAAANSVKPDKHFNLFREVTSSNSCQVLRYDCGGKPLWVTDNNILQDTLKVPDCEKCGAARQFEFQVMPQLLNYLKLDSTGDSIDWATLVVYTCSKDCDLEGQYWKEFIWKQDFVSEH